MPFRRSIVAGLGASALAIAVGAYAFSAGQHATREGKSTVVRTPPAARPLPPHAPPFPPSRRYPPYSNGRLFPHPAIVAGPLNGLPTAWGVAHRRPLAVIVENYNPDSRPQTGLDQASMVFETVAEDGITRFMAVYLEHDPPTVGPVRSTRIYFNAWANGLHAILDHAGGNDDALAQLFTLHNVADLNEVAFEDASYVAHVPFFVRSADRVMPHNLYTYPAQVRVYFATKHVPLSGTFPDQLPHHAPDAPPHRPHGGTLDLNFSSPDYAVEYRYDPATDRYLRWMGGTPHTDARTGRQLAPANVVVLQATIAPDPHGGPANPGAVYVQSTGTNKATLFRDGKRFDGIWRKPHGGSPLQLLDTHGKPFTFNPGQTWIEVLPTTGSTTWAPVHG